MTCDIVYDHELDASLFSLDPPEGYHVTTVRKTEPTEKEMVEWLGIRAECNDNVFPDDPGPLHGEQLGKIMAKFNQGKKLTAAEKREMNASTQRDRDYPVKGFAEKVAGDSWHYAGKGVKLGDMTAIVCWYKPEDSKTYRVVYGDLSVKDIAPEDLPSQAEP